MQKKMLSELESGLEKIRLTHELEKQLRDEVARYDTSAFLGDGQVRSMITERIRDNFEVSYPAARRSGRMFVFVSEGKHVVLGAHIDGHAIQARVPLNT